MFWLKGCPRCHGDLFQERDQYGWYVLCFHCGHYLSEGEEALLRYVYGGPILDRLISTRPVEAETTRLNSFRQRNILAA